MWQKLSDKTLYFNSLLIPNMLKTILIFPLLYGVCTRNSGIEYYLLILNVFKYMNVWHH